MKSFLPVVVAASVLAGCASSPNYQTLASPMMADSGAFSEIREAPGQQNQKLVIQTASMRIAAKDPSKAANQVKQLTEALNGRVLSTNQYGDGEHYLSVQVPQTILDTYLNQLADYGEVESLDLYQQDVTTEVIDIEARLTNLTQLRDRYRQLLEQATIVSEMVEIERELTRVQTEIDSIEGRRRHLLQQVAMSQVDISIEQQRILGPLGHVVQGGAWVIEKLFVIK